MRCMGLPNLPGSFPQVRHPRPCFLTGALLLCIAGSRLVTVGTRRSLTMKTTMLLHVPAQESFPEYDIKAVSEDAPSKYPADNSKAAKELGLSLTSPKSSYIDMVYTLIQLGIVAEPEFEGSA